MNNEKEPKKNRVRSFTTDSMEEMEDALNEFFDNKEIIASPIFPVTDDNNQTKWYSMVYYKIPPREVEETKEEAKILIAEKLEKK